MDTQIILALGGTFFLVFAISLALVARFMMARTSQVIYSVGWHN